MEAQHTVAVDVNNDGSTADIAIDIHRFNETRRVYRGPNHTDASEETLQFSVTDPTRNGEDPGRGKSRIKYVRTVSVANNSGTGSIKLPLIAEVSFSVPVGTDASETLIAQQWLEAILADKSIVTDLVDKRDM